MEVRSLLMSQQWATSIGLQQKTNVLSASGFGIFFVSECNVHSKTVGIQLINLHRSSGVYVEHLAVECYT